MPAAVIINPGRSVSEGTVEQARANADEWLERMRADGITGVYIDHDATRPCEYGEARWVFTFRHEVTGATAELTIDGLTDDEKRGLVFWPKVYWKGSSCSHPDLSDFLTDGHHIAIVPYPAP